jgi:translation initiation factor 4E
MSNFPQGSVESPNSLPVQSEEAKLESPHQKEALPSSLEFINKINENESPVQPFSPPIQNLDTINSINNINAQEENNNNLNEIKSEPISHEPNKTKLENKFSFWYRIDDNIQYQLQKQALDKKEYEVQVKKIAEFDTIEDFWGIFQHLRKPDSCRAGIEYFMFKEPIKPMWEDENNKNGGKISIKLRKGFTTIIWEEMIFALIGGIFPKEMKEAINGIVVTSRKEFNTLQIWFKNYEDNLVNDLKQCIRDLIVIPPEVNLEIKQFNKTNNNNYKKDYGNNNKKEYGNNNNKKSGGYYNNKGYNNNYYGDDEYEYDFEYYNKDKNDYKKNKHQNYKNK